MYIDKCIREHLIGSSAFHSSDIFHGKEIDWQTDFYKKYFDRFCLSISMTCNLLTHPVLDWLLCGEQLEPEGDLFLPAPGQSFWFGSV